MKVSIIRFLLPCVLVDASVEGQSYTNRDSHMPQRWASIARLGRSFWCRHWPREIVELGGLREDFSRAKFGLREG